MLCSKCGTTLKELTEDYIYCDNPDCSRDGWDRAEAKEMKE